MTCGNITSKLSKAFAEMSNRNRFEVVGEDEVSFVMVKTNASAVAKELDRLRKNPKKFMCLNDDIRQVSV